jgi:TRAP-type C4-dicarboxylate transport system permease large subunit
MSMLILYIVTGFFLDIIPIVLITAPVLHPLLVQMGYDPVWISVLVAMTILIGSVTPPFGMNVFALSAMVPDVPISSIFKGVMPFCVAMLVCLILILLFPQIALFLPSLMG